MEEWGRQPGKVGGAGSWSLEYHGPRVWDQIDFVTQAVILMTTPAARGWLAPGNPLRLGFGSCTGRGEGARAWVVAKGRREGLEHGEECVPRG